MVADFALARRARAFGAILRPGDRGLGTAVPTCCSPASTTCSRWMHQKRTREPGMASEADAQSFQSPSRGWQPPL